MCYFEERQTGAIGFFMYMLIFSAELKNCEIAGATEEWYFLSTGKPITAFNFKNSQKIPGALNLP